MKSIPSTYQKPLAQDERLGNPLVIGSFGLSALTFRSRFNKFVKNYWPYMLGVVVVGVGGYYVYKHQKK